MRKDGTLHARVGLQLVHHQSASTAGEAAMGLYTFCILYSRLNELDGFIPLKVAERGWSGDVKANRAHLKTLAIPSVALLISMIHPLLGEGFLVIKYEDFNETKAEISKRREAARSKKQGQRKGVSPGTGIGTDPPRPSVVPDSDSVSDSEISDLGSRATSDDGVFGQTIEEWRQGISAVTGTPAPRLSPGEVRDLANVRLHAKGLRGAELLAWVRAVASDFARHELDDNQGRYGLTPARASKWLTAKRPAPRSGKHVVQPAEGRCWTAGEDWVDPKKETGT